MSQGFIHTSESITATNGLTKTAGNITLGGALSTNTTISGSYTLSFTNTSVSIATGIFSTQTTFNFATASTVPYFDASKNLISSAVTPTELGYLSGVTSAIQTQLGNKQPLDADLTSWALITRASGFDTFATTSTSANLRTLLTDENGTGVALFDGATSPTFTTDITTPLIIGGSAVGSQLTLQGTSANGTSTVAAINFLVGNNGATTAGKIYNDGTINLGNAVNTTQRLIRIGQDTATIDIGSWVSNTAYAAIHMGVVTPSSTNYNLLSNGSVTQLNGVSSFSLRVGNSELIGTTGNRRINFITIADNGGSTLPFNFTTPLNTNQAASTASPDFLVTLTTKQWATGALAATQNFFSITQPTISFVGASTATLVATVGIAGAPIQGTNATNTTSVGLLIEAGAITGATTSYGAYFNAQTGGSTNYALGLAGDLRFPTGNATISGSNAVTIQSSSGSNVVLNAGSSTQTYVIFRGQGTERFSLTTGTNTSAAVSYAVYSPASNTGQTASTEINGFLYNSYTRTWAAGAITTQREQYIKTVTYAFASASTITSAYGMYVEAPTAGSNATITNNFALGVSGNINLATNNFGIYGVDSGGTARKLLFFTNSDNIQILGRPGTSDIIIDPTSGNTGSLIVKNNGAVGIGTAISPTAWLMLPAGAATASKAPLKFTSGTNLTVAEAGAMEYDGSNLYFTNSTPTRILLTQSFPMGETYMTGNATATTIASSGVYYKVSGTTTLSHAHEFTAGGTDNRLTYTGTITKMFHVACTLSVKSAGSNDIIYARIAKNGTTIPAGTVQQKLGSIGDVASTAIHVVVELATNDYIELFVMNNSGTSSLTITDMNMFGMGIYH